VVPVRRTVWSQGVLHVHLQLEEHDSPVTQHTLNAGRLHLTLRARVRRSLTSPSQRVWRRSQSSEEGWKFHVLSSISSSSSSSRCSRSFIVEEERQATWHAYLIGYGLLKLQWGYAYPYLCYYQYWQQTQITEGQERHQAAQH